MKAKPEFSGRIVGVTSHGTIVAVRVYREDETADVYFDHRCFWRLVEAEGMLLNRQCDVYADGHVVLSAVN